MKEPMRILFSVLAIAAIALLFGCGDDNNPTPVAITITGMTPTQVSLGQVHVAGTITGTNLAGVTAVSLGDGIAIESFSGKSATEISVTFSVSTTASPGPKTITITTSTGTANVAALLTVLSNVVPNAAFRIDPAIGSKDTLFTFDASRSDDQETKRLAFQWDFGDGKRAQGEVVHHKFDSIKTFQISLVVTDKSGAADSASKELTIVKNSPPIARFTVSPKSNGDTNTVFHFDASKSSDADGRVVVFSWKFGDGGKAIGKEVDHQFKNAGNFDVTLTVSDNKGSDSAVESAKIKVDKSLSRDCLGKGGGHQTIIKGVVVGVEAGQWAIVNFGAGHTCANTFHKCDDFRKLSPENFYGIVDKMADRGNGVLAVHNSCPYRWPPTVGERVFVYFKTCAQNYCP